MPCVKFHNSKWRALLAHLAPPSLFPAASIKSASSFSSANTSCPSTCTVTNSCPLDLTSGSHSASICGPTIDLRLHPDSDFGFLRNSAGGNRTISCLEADLIAPCTSSPLSNDVDQLLYMCLDSPYDLDKQARSLDTLCTLCSATPGVADRCVDSGGIEIVLGILNSTPQPRYLPLIPSAFVEKSEKALHLLHLITTSSEVGCAAALQQTTAIITTLGKKLLRVSEACTASAIAILCTLCTGHSEAALFRKAVSETAIASKLVVVLQVASKDSTKRRAGRLLRLLAEQQQEQKSA